EVAQGKDLGAAGRQVPEGGAQPRAQLAGDVPALGAGPRGVADVVHLVESDRAGPLAGPQQVEGGVDGGAVQVTSRAVREVDLIPAQGPGAHALEGVAV